MKFKLWGKEKQKQENSESLAGKKSGGNGMLNGRYEITAKGADKKYVIRFSDSGITKGRSLKVSYEMLKRFSSGLPAEGDLHAGDEYHFDRAALVAEFRRKYAETNGRKNGKAIVGVHGVKEDSGLDMVLSKDDSGIELSEEQLANAERAHAEISRDTYGVKEFD